jgi:hypothetical protein
VLKRNTFALLLLLIILVLTITGIDFLQRMYFMPRFIQILQILIAVVIGGFVCYDLILSGIAIFQDKYITITIAMTLLLELSLFVIYKLIADD